MGIAARATWVAGDVATLGSLHGPFDIVFFGHIPRFLGPARRLEGTGWLQAVLP
jgi:hypothetical protein